MRGREAKFADIPERLWQLVAPRWPPMAAHPRGGRPRLPDRRMLAGIVYRLRTGCQWKALPREFAAGSTCHDRFTPWCVAGVCQQIFAVLVRFYDVRRKVKWRWASLDSALVTAPKGGSQTGPKPTDRGKLGVKRHILTDARGVPVAATITGATGHDTWLVGAVLDAVVLRAPRGPRRPVHLCLDKGYDYADAERAVRDRGVTPHIRRRGEPALVGCVRGRPRRWVVERTNAWHTRFRGLLIRWARRGARYQGLLDLACGLIAFAQAVR